jgi:hypothetical protein
VAGSCENGNKPFGSIKAGISLPAERQSAYQLSMKLGFGDRICCLLICEAESKCGEFAVRDLVIVIKVQMLKRRTG